MKFFESERSVSKKISEKVKKVLDKSESRAIINFVVRENRITAVGVD